MKPDRGQLNGMLAAMIKLSGEGRLFADRVGQFAYQIL
jgi:hypothetical protein